MGLSIFSNNGVNYPIITCDTCGEPIKDVRLAIIVFEEMVGDPILNEARIFHKGECDTGSKLYPNSNELSRYLRHVINNLHLGRTDIVDNRRQLVIDLPEPDSVCECFGKIPF